jgi:hypothetical protein
MGSRFGDNDEPGLDDEQEDRCIVEPACGSAIGKQLSKTPATERNDRNDPEETMSSFGRMSDADGGDRTGDEKQRSGGHARMVRPLHALVEPVGDNEEEACHD